MLATESGSVKRPQDVLVSLTEFVSRRQSKEKRAVPIAASLTDPSDTAEDALKDAVRPLVTGVTPC